MLNKPHINHLIDIFLNKFLSMRIFNKSEEGSIWNFMMLACAISKKNLPKCQRFQISYIIEVNMQSHHIILEVIKFYININWKKRTECKQLAKSQKLYMNMLDKRWKFQWWLYDRIHSQNPFNIFRWFIFQNPLSYFCFRSNAIN